MGHRGIYASPETALANRDRTYPDNIKELLEAARPLIKLIAEKHGAHTTAIVNSSRVELLDGNCSAMTEDYIKD